MTLNEFINKYNGKYLDYDGYYGFQCVDLMRAYVKEVLGWNPYTAIPSTGAAKNIFYNFVNNKYFTKIKNTPNGIPKKGDIIFFKTSILPPWLYGLSGHVAVVSDAWLMGLISFDQNWGYPKTCRFVNHTYKDCLGWLSPRR